MTAHILHKITCSDGTISRTLEPPAWTQLSYRWEIVPIHSIFEAYDGSTVKQVNSGATQKRRLVIEVGGKCAPLFEGMNQGLTWTVTLIAHDDVTSADAHTVWPLGPPQQTVQARNGERTWTMEFIEA